MVRNSILVCVFGLLSINSNLFAFNDNDESYLQLRDSIDLSSPLDTEPLSKDEYNTLLKKIYEEYSDKIDKGLSSMSGWSSDEECSDEIDKERSFEIADIIENYISYKDCKEVDPENPSARYANRILSTFILIDIFHEIYGVSRLPRDGIQKAIFEIEGAKELCDMFYSKGSSIKPAKR